MCVVSLKNRNQMFLFINLLLKIHHNLFLATESSNRVDPSLTPGFVEPHMFIILIFFLKITYINKYGGFTEV